MNPLLNAEMSQHHSADVGRNLRKHRIASARPQREIRSRGARVTRMFAVLRPARQV